NDHAAMPLRLELRGEMLAMVGVSAPGGGGGAGGGGKTGGGGGSDFGQNAAIAMLPDCFAGNFDASCAETSYQGEPMLAANAPLGRLIGGANDIYPGNCSASAAPGTFGD